MKYRGTLIWKGHRAYGSLFYHFLLTFLLFALTVYLFYAWFFKGEYHYSYVLPYHLHILVYPFIDSAALFFLSWIYLYYKHVQWTFLITDKEMIVKFGIVALNVKEYLYDELQDAHSEQNLRQRLLMYGNLKFVLLMSGTGMAEPSDVNMPYVSEPYHVSQLVIQKVKVGLRSDIR